MTNSPLFGQESVHSCRFQSWHALQALDCKGVSSISRRMGSAHGIKQRLQDTGRATDSEIGAAAGVHTKRRTSTCNVAQNNSFQKHRFEVLKSCRARKPKRSHLWGTPRNERRRETQERLASTTELLGGRRAELLSGTLRSSIYVARTSPRASFLHLGKHPGRPKRHSRNALLFGGAVSIRTRERWRRRGRGRGGAPTPRVKSHKCQSATSQSAGLRSQNRRLLQPQNATNRFKAPRDWALFSASNLRAKMAAHASRGSCEAIRVRAYWGSSGNLASPRQERRADAPGRDLIITATITIITIINSINIMNMNINITTLTMPRAAIAPRHDRATSELSTASPLRGLVAAGAARRPRARGVPDFGHIGVRQETSPPPIRDKTSFRAPNPGGGGAASDAGLRGEGSRERGVVFVRKHRLRLAARPHWLR